MGISVENFLNRYYSSEQLKEPLADIGLSVGGTKKERIARIVENWSSYHRDWYELLDYLDWGTLAQICEDFKISYSDYAKEETLHDKIENEMVLDFRKETMEKINKIPKHSEKSSFKKLNFSSEPTINFNIGSIHLSKNQWVGVILSIAVALAIGVPQLYFAMNPPVDQITEAIKEKFESGEIVITNSQNEMLLDGEQGLTYTDKKAGFTVQKPNANWYFIKVEDYVNQMPEFSGTVTSSYLGGVFVATDSPGNVMIVVEKLPENLDLGIYIDGQMARAEELLETDITVIKKFVSPDGNWAVVEGTGMLTAQEYGRQILHKYKDRLYIIQTTGDPPNVMSEEQKNELEQIIESFRIIV